MEENILILAGGSGGEAYAAAVAAATGDDLGLVLTAIELGTEKVSGGRIEEDRSYGGRSFQTFDEPVFIGSAIAQLQGHADAVIVDSMDVWARRLLQRFPGEPLELDAEIASLTSVMNARMSVLLLVVKPPAEDAVASESDRLTARIVREIEPLCARVIDLRSGEPVARKGPLPAAGL